MNASSPKIRKLTIVRRVVFLLVAMVVVLPYVFHPAPMKFEPTKDATSLFNQVNALRPGSHMILSVDFDPTAQAELYPMTRAVLRHCFRSGVVPVVMTFNINGINLAKDLIESTAAENWQTCERCIRGITFPCGKKDLTKYVLDRNVQFKKQHVAYQGVLAVFDQIGDRTYKDLEDFRTEDIFRRIPSEEMQSGRNYVFLGFKTGGSMLLLNMGSNLKGAFETDFYSQPTAPMPALKDVNSLKDFNFGFVFTASGSYMTWILFGSDRYGFPLGTGVTAVMAPDLVPFVRSKQIAGYLGGLRGAADYELLLHRSGDGVLGMYAQSSTHVLVIVLILFANIRLLVQHWSGKRKDSANA